MRTTHTRLIVLLVSALLGENCYAEWKNPAERYMQEYKNHIDATCPVAQSDIKHFVYFARDREFIVDHPFLDSDRFSGAQIMYSWAQLEKSIGQYDFSIIEKDIAYLAGRNKKLFIQLQDATFHPKYKAVPAYLQTAEFEGGVVPQYDQDNKIEGWVAKRWNPKVQKRFVKLLAALGKQFDGRIEGINLQETAIGVSQEVDPEFTPKAYLASIKLIMSGLGHAFNQSTTLQYANFMPGEWLPWDDKGLLKSIYRHGEQIGVGLGAPDLMIRRKGQLNHALAMMHENQYKVPLGIAIQDGNYIGLTNSMTVQKMRDNIVPVLHSFASQFLKVDYMFWVNQAPYFEEDVLPCFSDNASQVRALEATRK